VVLLCGVSFRSSHHRGCDRQSIDIICLLSRLSKPRQQLCLDFRLAFVEEVTASLQYQFRIRYQIICEDPAETAPRKFASNHS
jgi:hypothetical protein